MQPSFQRTFLLISRTPKFSPPSPRLFSSQTTADKSTPKSISTVAATASKIRQNIVRDWLNHAAGFFRALALVQTDVLLLQGFMLASSKLTVYRLARRKETTATAYALLFTGLSAFATFNLVRERLVWLDGEEEIIWSTHFDMLTKPMFKKLMRCAEIRTVPQENDLTSEPDTPALSDYFSNKYPFKGQRVLTIGGVPTLSLLLDGKARIVRNLARNNEDYRVDKRGDVKLPLKPRSIKPVLVEQGPGFNGEVSLSERLGYNDEKKEKVKARADVTLLPGSRYIVWNTLKLEELLKDDHALRNALLACLGQTISKKLYDVTWSLGKSNEHAQRLKHMLYEEFYKQEVLDTMRHTLVETIVKDGEHAAREPNGVGILLPRLTQLQAERGISDKVQERALIEQGIDLKKAKTTGESLLELCDTDVGLSSTRHTEKHTAFKHILKENKSRNRVVRLSSFSDPHAGMYLTGKHATKPTSES